jgi:hypothetical protein
MAACGGADMVTTHCHAYFRMQDLRSMAGYLPICDANALTLELGERALRRWSAIARSWPDCFASTGHAARVPLPGMSFFGNTQPAVDRITARREAK